MLRGPTVLIEELCLLLLGPAQQSWIFLDVCARPRSSGQSSSMRTLQLFWMPLRELPEKHLGKLCGSHRGAMLTASRTGAAVLDVPRRLCQAEEQWSLRAPRREVWCLAWAVVCVCTMSKHHIESIFKALVVRSRFIHFRDGFATF